MNGKVSMFLVAGLLACSTLVPARPPEDPATNRPADTVPAAAKPPGPAARVILRQLPLEQPKESNGVPPPRLCHLGKDCMALDPQPFELCQVSSKSCGDKLAEFLQVQQSKSGAKPAPPRVFTSR